METGVRAYIRDVLNVKVLFFLLMTIRPIRIYQTRAIGEGGERKSCGGKKYLQRAEKDEKETQLHHGVFVFCEIQRFFGHLLYAALHLCVRACVCVK